MELTHVSTNRLQLAVAGTFHKQWFHHQRRRVVLRLRRPQVHQAQGSMTSHPTCTSAAQCLLNTTSGSGSRVECIGWHTTQPPPIQYHCADRPAVHLCGEESGNKVLDPHQHLRRGNGATSARPATGKRIKGVGRDPLAPSVPRWSQLMQLFSRLLA